MARHIVCLTFDHDHLSGFIARGLTSPTAISRGAKAHVAFDVARAAYRARQPWLSGERLDEAVARALATDTARPAEAPVSPEPEPSAPFRADR